MQDVIRREITISAPIERVYEAIANPELVVKWFPETLEGLYEVGQQPVFGFGEDCTSQVYIVAAQPHTYFAYRWVPGSKHFMGDVLSVANTLVEFTLEEAGDGRCKVTLTESGFAALPVDVMETSFQENGLGWDFMLGRFGNYFEGQ
ncbi:SRPBCC domain-containing protein [Microbulbifer aggregans]|uniref:SRPBCC domain-containing protein n=1 Tax=Microbulbifer aggregans TaxID=1769779 RepID=UPI001CFF4AFC|nr:SRPBCC domain-containing protein [Microbulbifer aggregans]